MKLVDLNLLLYAVNRDSAVHGAAKSWLDETLSGDEVIAMPWVVLLGFLRVGTHPQIFPRPLTIAQTVAVVDSWLGRPNVIALAPGDEHWRILRTLIAETGTGGNLATDTHLAALAIESGAELCSTDSDFARFRGLRWTNPLK